MNNNTTAQERKSKATELLKRLKIYKPYIEGFEQDDQVCFYENFGGFWIYQEPEIEAKMKEIEKKYNCTVYAVTQEYTDFGECYDFLIVTDYPEEWSTLLTGKQNEYYAFSYVWNKTDEWCSELGTVVLQSLFGGIKRIG